MHRQMIFVTLGSQKFQFNRLLKAVDDLVARGIISETVFAQTGYSDYIPKHYEHQDFLDRESFVQREEDADIVMTHGGTGAIVGAVKKGKIVIAAPRLARYGEHVDDHQVQLLEEFENMGIIIACYDLACLADAYLNAGEIKLLPYQSEQGKIIGDIEEYIDSIQMNGKRGYGR